MSVCKSCLAFTAGLCSPPLDVMDVADSATAEELLVGGTQKLETLLLSLCADARACQNLACKDGQPLHCSGHTAGSANQQRQTSFSQHTCGRLCLWVTCAAKRESSYTSAYPATILTLKASNLHPYLLLQPSSFRVFLACQHSSHIDSALTFNVSFQAGCIPPPKDASQPSASRRGG